jgi:hypothetical protein
VVSVDPEAIELVGEESRDAEDLVICRIGLRSYPFDLCAERFLEPRLLSRILAHDPSLGDP